MGKNLLAQVKGKAISTFMAGRNSFNLFGVNFSISNTHTNNYAVTCPTGELFRIVGDKRHYTVMEV